MRDIRLTEAEATALLRACEILRDKLGVEVAERRKPVRLSEDEKDTLRMFWDAYPRKGRERAPTKHAVAKAWRGCSAKPSRDELLSALDAWKKSEKWSGGHIDGAAKFIRQAFWESVPRPVNVVGFGFAPTSKPKPVEQSDDFANPQEAAKFLSQ